MHPRSPAELEEILNLPDDASLQQLDATLLRFIHFCATYHGEQVFRPSMILWLIVVLQSNTCKPQSNWNMPATSCSNRNFSLSIPKG